VCARVCVCAHLPNCDHSCSTKVGQLWACNHEEATTLVSNLSSLNRTFCRVLIPPRWWFETVVKAISHDHPTNRIVIFFTFSSCGCCRSIFPETFQRSFLLLMWLFVPFFSEFLFVRAAAAAGRNFLDSWFDIFCASTGCESGLKLL